MRDVTLVRYLHSEKTLLATTVVSSPVIVPLIAFTPAAVVPNRALMGTCKWGKTAGCYSFLIFLTFSCSRLHGLLTALVRNVALVGHLHSGKTLLADMLVEATHPSLQTLNPESERHLRYTDTRLDEQERGISIKAMPVSLVLEDSAGKSFLCNVVDTPGHVNFSDELTAGLRLADAAVLVVDAAEGVMVSLSCFCPQGLGLDVVIGVEDRARAQDPRFWN